MGPTPRFITRNSLGEDFYAYTDSSGEEQYFFGATRILLYLTQ